jgi:hypothetical protein
MYITAGRVSFPPSGGLIVIILTDLLFLNEVYDPHVQNIKSSIPIK